MPGEAVHTLVMKLLLSGFLGLDFVTDSNEQISLINKKYFCF